ncbi:MAG: PadR family transcriptional regulator [Candidatus Nomurabacteria bacterium]|jgi:DNA-binding PadR family transcriptional regulator|nr:PadR family transcriptional regulator [Candidatus Nomurabacteria bacterium]
MANPELHDLANFGRVRAKRGLVEPTILLALLEKQPLSGYDIIKYIEKGSLGGWKPSSGSIYPTLQTLEDKKLVSFVESGDKKLYSLTKKGTKLAKHNEFHLRHHFSGRMPNMKHMMLMRTEVFDIMRFGREVLESEDEEKISELAQILNEAKQKIREITENNQEEDHE